MIIPKGMPVPEDNTGFTVPTEWGAPTLDKNVTQDGDGPHMMSCYTHCISHCSSHCMGHDAEVKDEETWYLGGQKLEVGSPVHSLLAAVIEVWG